MPTCFLERFAEAPNPDDTTTRLLLLTAFQRNPNGRHRGRREQKKITGKYFLFKH